MIRVAVLTVSDGVAVRRAQGRGRPVLRGDPEEVRDRAPRRLREVLPDEPKQVARAIRVRADAGEADLILLTGGTGVAPRDRTPEGVREAIDFEVPGLAEKMRFETSRGFSAAYLSRQVAGVRKKCLVVSLPGSPRGAADCLAAILALVPHAIALIQGEKAEHPPRGSRT